MRDVGFPVVVAGVLLWNTLAVQPAQMSELASAVREASKRLAQLDQTQVRILELLRQR